MKKSNIAIMIGIFACLSCSKEEAITIAPEPEIIVEENDETANNTAPLKVEIVSPINDEVVQQFLEVMLSWEGNDPDENDTLKYTLLFGQDPTALEVLATEIEVGNFILERLITGETYYWQIQSTDSKGATSLSDLSGFKVYEKVFEGDYVISDQATATIFSTEGYTRVTGSLQLNGENIDITGLANLNHIEKGLLIVNTNLFDLTGLHHLINASSLTIINNPVLKQVEALQGVRDFNIGISIANNTVLSSLEGIKASNSLERNLEIINNPAISDLSVFANVAAVGGQLFIAENNSLTNLAGLENVREVGDFVTIDQNENLSSLNGLNNLETILGDLSILENKNLKDLSALSQLKRTRNLIIFNNDSLDELSDFSLLESVEIELIIEGNKDLETIKGFDNLKNVQFVQIATNPNLLEITGFNEINILKNGLRIYQNPALTIFNAFDTLEEGSIGVTNLDKLRTISFPKLRTSDGILLQNNNSLENFEANNLTYANQIVITVQPSLTSFGLAVLENVGNGSINISENEKLSNFCSLIGYAKIALEEGEEGQDILIRDNAYNPTIRMIAAGDCKR